MIVGRFAYPATEATEIAQAAADGQRVLEAVSPNASGHRELPRFEFVKRLQRAGHTLAASLHSIPRLEVLGIVRTNGASDDNFLVRLVDDGGAPALTKEAAAVLLYLADQAPVLSSLDDIESKAGLSRSRAKGACDELIGKEFAHRPEGQNKGIAATSSGLAIANKLSTKSAQT